MPGALRRGLPAVLLLVLAPVAASCGGGADKDAQAVLDRAFRTQVRSADLRLDAALQFSAGGPYRIQASGPFRTEPDRQPAVDLELRLGAAGSGQTIQAGYLSTGERTFVEFEDVFYEQPRAQVAQANQAFRRRNAGGSLRALGLDPRSWLDQAQDEGEEEIGGVQTTHVSGRLDVARVVADFNRLIARQGRTFGGATGQAAPQPLSERAVERLTETLKNPSFDIYVGRRDGAIRRLSGRIEVEAPEDGRDRAQGAGGGSLEFTLQFSRVNGDQRIEAPAKARPLSDLRRALGTGILEGLGGSGEEGSRTAPRAPRDGASPGSTSTGPDADAFRRYSECLESAPPRDTRALQRCSDMLR